MCSSCSILVTSKVKLLCQAYRVVPFDFKYFLTFDLLFWTKLSIHFLPMVEKVIKWLFWPKCQKHSRDIGAQSCIPHDAMRHPSIHYWKRLTEFDIISNLTMFSTYLIISWISFLNTNYDWFFNLFFTFNVNKPPFLHML